MARFLIILLLTLPANSETTFLVDVLPIVDKRCAVCHTELTDYKYVLKNFKWLTGRRAKDVLSKKERDTIKSWIDGGKKK